MMTEKPGTEKGQSTLACFTPEPVATGEETRAPTFFIGVGPWFMVGAQDAPWSVARFCPDGTKTEPTCFESCQDALTFMLNETADVALPEFHALATNFVHAYQTMERYAAEEQMSLAVLHGAGWEQRPVH